MLFKENHPPIISVSRPEDNVPAAAAAAATPPRRPSYRLPRPPLCRIETMPEDYEGLAGYHLRRMERRTRTQSTASVAGAGGGSSGGTPVLPRGPKTGFTAETRAADSAGTGRTRSIGFSSAGSSLKDVYNV